MKHSQKGFIVPLLLSMILLTFVMYVYTISQNTTPTPPSKKVEKPVYPKNLSILNDEDIKLELNNLGKINDWPFNKNINSKDYPKVIGSYYANGLTLTEIYFCSDICPDYGGVSIVFDNIKTKEKCSEIGGKDLIDPAWGSYIGCAPNISKTIISKSWIKELTEQINKDPSGCINLISQCEYNKGVAYYTWYDKSNCVDVVTSLYDVNGNVICNPLGGFVSGNAPEKCPSFNPQMCKIIWQKI